MGCTTKQDAVDRKLRAERRAIMDGKLRETCPLCNQLYGNHTAESCPEGAAAVMAHFDEHTRKFCKEAGFGPQA